jgi:hypothetical protein
MKILSFCRCVVVCGSVLFSCTVSQVENCAFGFNQLDIYPAVFVMDGQCCLWYCG